MGWIKRLRIWWAGERAEHREMAAVLQLNVQPPLQRYTDRAIQRHLRQVRDEARRRKAEELDA